MAGQVAGRRHDQVLGWMESNGIDGTFVALVLEETSTGIRAPDASRSIFNDG